MRNKQKDAVEMSAKRRRMMENGFRMFAENGIESVNLPDIAIASGVGRATIFRYFPSKLDLVIAIGTWKWEEYITERSEKASQEKLSKLSAAEHLAFYLDSFLDLYRNHPDILRFNQYFNIYVQGKKVTPEQIKPYMDMIRSLLDGFHDVCRKAREDHTVRTDIPEEVMLSSTFHIMLAAVTRYAIGLFTFPGSPDNHDQELIMLRDLLLKEYTCQ